MDSDPHAIRIRARAAVDLSGRALARLGPTGILLIVLSVGSIIAVIAIGRPAAPKEPAAAVKGVMLSAAQRAAAGIVVTPIQVVSLPPILRAPGEVRTNDYITNVVGPRITATVVTRRGRLGDVLVKGQVLVTLYSRDMAEAQSGFVLSERDLARYRRLDASAAIAGQQLDQAIAKRQELFGRLQSFGLTAAQIGLLTAKGLANSATGQFDLVAPIAGTITKDDFREGDVVDAGKALFEITNPRNVWVEAHLSQPLARTIAGSTGRVASGGQTRTARIVQIGDTVDESTRTVIVRLALDNPDLWLKPGQFVDTELFGSSKPVLAVPTAAVLKGADGDWIVYVEQKDGTLHPHRVTVLYAVDDKTAIGGLAPGTLVVTGGAFFVHSEAQKSSFESDD